MKSTKGHGQAALDSPRPAGCVVAMRSTQCAHRHRRIMRQRLCHKWKRPPRVMPRCCGLAIRYVPVFWYRPVLHGCFQKRVTEVGTMNMFTLWINEDVSFASHVSSFSRVFSGREGAYHSSAGWHHLAWSNSRFCAPFGTNHNARY